MLAPRRAPVTGTELTRITASGDAPLHHVDARYLSWSIDVSVFAGGLWWEGSNKSRRGIGTSRLSPLALDARELNRLVRALGPAYLRIGGSEADKIHYFEAPPGESNALVLSREQWDDLHEFLRRHDLKLFFTCKYGLFRRNEHGRWDGSALEHLLAYSRERDYAIDVFELGNELNAYWAFHGLLSQPRAKNLAQDYRTFKALVRRHYPEARICGPGSAFWPRLGETIRPISNITPKFLRELAGELDIVDWHYYPFQSERSPVRTRAARRKHMTDPASFTYFERYSQHLMDLRDRLQPQAELWTGETGSAQCGGQPFRSDRWVSGFWWADQLGLGARLGQKVMVRQALVGGDYGLIDRLTLKPRPDYWVSWLWRQLMGTGVYAVASSRPQVRAYLHDSALGAGRCLLLINLDEQPAPVQLEGLGAVGRRYTVTAKQLTSRKLRINGVKPKLKKGRIALDRFPVQTGLAVLPPHSISFWEILPAAADQYCTSSISIPSGS
ncbi:glycoside hydrolase [Mangrovimicrobium sediminis]|uniref:Glycoside hydrolase n=1 Tax=Mangrovimicrobium sediminis TaxID=2562682 RepID=A0A4Z0LUC0_9GAMM|nr:glycoside hydrolase [Haliea sp. SAOS-164]TGD70900.1 glycoside hydrolase [Haliea sp. SAOS-164]